MPHEIYSGTVTFYDQTEAEVRLLVKVRKAGAKVGEIIVVQSYHSRCVELPGRVIVLANGDIHLSPNNAIFVADPSP